MQETKKQMVNHIRIMVEQAEGNPLHPHVSTAPQGTRHYCLIWRSVIICTPLSSLQKLFVLLLHFPPSMFYDRCYPALFLNGWDHHYFDSLQPEPEGIVDIRYVCMYSNWDLVRGFLSNVQGGLLVSEHSKCIVVNRKGFCQRSDSLVNFYSLTH